MAFFNPCGYKSLISNAQRATELLVSQGAKNIYFVEARYIGIAAKIINPSIPPKLNSSIQRIIIPMQSILFAKESLLNSALDFLPSHITKILCLDADIEFEKDTWYNQISTDLDACDVLQPFSIAKMYEKNQKDIKETKISWIKSFLNNPESDETKMFKSHAGYAFACKRSYLLQNKGLFSAAVGGSGDEIQMRIASGVTCNVQKFKYLQENLNTYRKNLKEDIILGFSDLSVRHLFHGDTNQRQYVSRHAYFMENEFNVNLHCKFNGYVPEFIGTDEDKLKWNALFFVYFFNRNDDDVKEHVQKDFKTFYKSLQKGQNGEERFKKISVKKTEEPVKQPITVENFSAKDDTLSVTKNNGYDGNYTSKNKEQSQDVPSSPEYCCWGSCIGTFSWDNTSRTISHKDVLIDVRTGLFNRLRVLAAILWINSKERGQWTIWCHWPINQECSVKFNEFYLSGGTNTLKIIDSEDEALYVAQRILQERIFGDFNSSARAPGPLTVLRNLSVKPPDNFGTLISHLNIHPKFYALAKLKEKTFPPRPWTGLHIRRCDAVAMAAKLGKEMPSMEQYIDFVKKFNYHTILATDDPDVIQLMKYRLGEHRVTVISDPKLQKQIKTHYGLRPDGGIEILVDAIILSKCQEFLGTPTSSMSEMIELWRKHYILRAI